MTQKISSVNIEAFTLSSFTGPLISTVSIANSSYVIVDDTAVSNAGGYAVIAGSNFVSGAQVLFGSTSATSVTYVDSSTLRVEVPALTAGSYVMYVQNPDGSTAIRLNGITSSPIPVWGTDSTLTQQDAEVPFSISLAASSDSGVTFALSSGSTLPPGTTLAANGVFSGTITIEEQTTYNFSVDAIDAENQDTLRSFSVTVLTGDENYKDTVLHLSGETSNNTWITDASTNGFALTVNGDTRPVAFSPYETVWSGQFDGTNDYISTPANSAFSFGIGDFTIECFMRTTDNSLAPGGYARSIMYIGDFDFYLRITAYHGGTDGALRVPGLSDGSTVSLKDGVWHHVALVRESNTIRLWIDGIYQTSGSGTTYSTNHTNVNTNVVGGRSNPIGGYFNGNISNVRVVKGTAVYTGTSNFTVPTSPLTAITGTSLLTCSRNRFIDASTNALAITVNDTPIISNFGPFVETDLVTGSGYFDGSGDDLTIPTNSAFTYGTGDFTIEMWLYITANPGDYAYFYAQGPNTTASMSLYLSGGKVNVWNGSNIIVGSTSYSLNRWYHVALSRSGTSLKLFLNGVEDGSATNSSNITTGSTYGSTIGRWVEIGDNRYFTGYISNARVVKGTALYTANFTPPTTPLTAITNTSLLTLQSRIGENNNRFVVDSAFNNIITRAGNVTQGTFSPFALTEWSGYFTGSSTSYISTPSTTILNTGQTYTVQCWIYPTSFTTSTSAVRRMYLFIKGLIYAGLSIHSDGTLGWYGWPTPGTMIVTSAAGTITTNSWQHVALVVNPGNYIKLFKNGVEVGTAGYTAAGVNGSEIRIGHGDTTQGTDGFIGYISNFKITELALTGGQLDYSTAPTISSPTGSSLLTLQTNGFNDTSNNNLTITPAAAAAAVSVQPFSPLRVLDSWSPTTVGGSMYFDGSGDYLNVSSVDTAFGSTADFTIDFWIYPTVINSATKAIFDPRTSDDSAHPLVWISTANKIYYFTTNAARITGTTTLTANQWYHVALVRNSGTTTLYLNGTVQGTPWADTTNYVTATTFRIAQRYTGTAFNYAGYIHNLRVVKGTAIYTSAFTPPTAPTTAVGGTTLLLNGTNGGIIDYTGKNNLETVGDAKIRNNIVKYGNGAMYFDGTGDYAYTRYSPDLDFGTGNFTVEFWMNPSNTNAAYRGIVGKPDLSVSRKGWALFQNAGTIRYFTNGSGESITTSSCLTAGSWTHIALVKNGSTTTIYANGTSVGTATNVGYTEALKGVAIGEMNSTVGWNGTFSYTGYIDDLRITKGVARYTANFTPRTSAFKTN
jgi:hypothetical protein